MLTLSVTRPATVGTTHTEEYDDYRTLLKAVCRQARRWHREGWQRSILDLSQRHGSVEFSHDDEADVIVVRWQSNARQCRECGSEFEPEADYQRDCSDSCHAAHHGWPEPAIDDEETD